MKQIRFIIILITLLFFGCCEKDIQNLKYKDIIENEIIISRRVNSFDDIVKWIREETELGRKLFKSLSINYPIRFEYNERFPPATMGYAGKGLIYYNLSQLYGYVKPLIFHELFHIFQMGNEVKRVRNLEIEAYIAQYLFHQSLGINEKFHVLSDQFTVYIKDLAIHAGVPGSTLASSSSFQETYSKALSYLREHQLYGNLTEYIEDRPPYHLNNIRLLFQL